jgi:hypothetical protein
MARPKKTSATLSTSQQTKVGKWQAEKDAPWGGFINIRVDEEQKEQFHQWCAENPEEGWRITDDLLAQGMKVGFAYDTENECYIMTLTGTLVEGSTERYCVTSRAGTLGDVIALSAWKHVVLVAGAYGDLRANGRLNNWG